MDSCLTMARTLAMTPSVSGDEEAAVRTVASTMGELGFDEVRIDDAGNAVGVIRATRPVGPTLLIDGHIDSIPLHSQERWTVDPFGGVIRDDRLFGLGICDQKASIAAAVHGVAAARDRLGGDVAVVASVCEEAMEGQALDAAIGWFEPATVIITEPSDTRLCIGQRGRAKLVTTVTGRACHAGHAGEGVNAAEALAALIGEARAVVHPTHPDLGRRDLMCIDVASWPFPSVSTVPGGAEARFDCRFLPGETEASLIALLEGCAEKAWSLWPEKPALDVRLFAAAFTTWTGDRFEAPEFCAAWWTDDAPTVQRAQDALAEAGLDPAPTHYSFCTNGSLTAGLLGIPTIGFGVGVEHIAHQVDEYVSLGSLAAGERGFAALAAHLTR